MKEREGRRTARLSAEAFLMVLLFLFLIGAAAVLFRSSSFAWFSRNMEVDVRGMQTQINGADILVSYYKSDPSGEGFLPMTDPGELFAGMMPGDSVRIKAAYRSLVDEDTVVSVRMTLPEGGEKALEIDGRYYYLSTQLKVVERDTFLLAPPPDRLGYDAPVALTDTALGEVTVPARGEAELIVTVVFVNYTDLDQSVYQGFGDDSGGEHCYRILESVLRDG